MVNSEPLVSEHVRPEPGVVHDMVEQHAEGAAQAPSSWQRSLQWATAGVDLLGSALASLIAFLGRFGTDADVRGGLMVGTAIVLPMVWMVVLAGSHAYERRVVGAGAVEAQILLRAFLYLTAAVTFVSYAARIDAPRGFVLFALPLTPLLSGLGRFGVRKVLHHRRANGGAMISVLAVGDAAAVVHFAEGLRGAAWAGMRVVGACVPVDVGERSETRRVLDAAGVPLAGDVSSVQRAVQRHGVHTVAVLSGRNMSHNLGWVSSQLEGTATDLIVSSGLTEIAGRRLHMQPVADLPLLHVDVPQFTGATWLLKTAFDKAVAAFALVIFAPVLLAIAAAVRLTSDGPAMFRQTRVGRGGKTFTILKFRTMHLGAERRLETLLAHNQSDGGMLFKIRDDPRVTRIGRLLRRFSLDELPQLCNVVGGSMSLVGPRPPLPSEVSQYEARVRRRLLVKPGLTGLWQISGRSDLSWEESVRLDLHYVESWSLALDLVVLAKTVGAVLRSDGAY